MSLNLNGLPWQGKDTLYWFEDTVLMRPKEFDGPPRLRLDLERDDLPSWVKNYYEEYNIYS